MLLFDNGPIQDLIQFAKDNARQIRSEHDKMIRFYTDNPDLLQDVAQRIKDENTDDDYYSNLVNKEASGLINDPVNAKWKFDDNMLLDSIEKINKQIRKIPNEVLLESENAKIFFYDLMKEPDLSGSRIVLSRLILNWRNFESEFFAISN